MRQSFALLVACLACAAGAAQAEDRFGPQPVAVAHDRAALIYDTGAALSWSGKTQPQSAATSDIRTLQPTPLVDGLLRHTSASPYPRPHSSQPAAPAPAQGAVQGSVQGSVQTPMAVAAPQAAATQTAAMGPIPPAQPRFPQYTPVASPTAAAQAAPNAQTAVLQTGLFDATVPAAAQAEADAAPRPRVVANTANGANAPVGARLYSVHSGYGMEPDAIPLAQAGVGQ